MKSLLSLFTAFLIMGYVSAQDSTKTAAPRSPADTVKSPPKAGLKVQRKKGKIFEREKPERRKFDSTLFTNNTIATRSDYMESMEKVYDMLSQVPAVTATFVHLDEIDDKLDDEDSALAILSERLSVNDRTLNIRNLQMFNTLLDELDRNTDGYARHLDAYDKKMDEVKKNVEQMHTDTLLLHIFRDSALKASFQVQLQQLKLKWRQADSLMRLYSDQINDLKTQATANSITIEDLTSKVDQALKDVGTRAFGKERRYLWEPRSPGTHNGFSRDAFKRSLDGEQQLARYYFANTRTKRVWLFVTGLAFFFWVAFNFRSLRRRDSLKALNDFNFRYITPWPWIATLVFILSLAPLFDAHAPAIYIESTQFLLMVLLTIVFWKRFSRPVFYGWCIFLLLFLLVPTTRILGLPISMQRWANFFQNGLSVAFGLLYLLSKKIADKRPRLMTAAAWLYVFMNLLAMGCNLMGRVTLSQIFGGTAVYAFAQTVSLSVFVRSVVEAFLLQIQTSRVRKKYPEHFDHKRITKSVGRFAGGVAILLWLIVFTSNLNIFDAINDALTGFFNAPRQVGSLPFTLGGILLFAGIIWVANFLQKYIAFFFGDTGDDAALDDTGQRSRLLVTRLILLTVGFLLAVAASGLSIDRITVIIGALGVGIGLGLQSIVNNFVSGVILIFDRPIRIGDTVEVGDKKGRVKEIGIRSSTLLTEEGAEVIIPNGDVLSHNIVNWTLSNNHVRMSLSFTIDKPQHVDAIQPEAIKEIVRGNSHVFAARQPEVLVNILNSKSMEVKVLFWGNDISKTTRTSAEVRAAIYRHLDQQGINVV
ncbi:MAG TPA: mechanosensitive ion channel domain-containing protein [Puia sp.]|nr:mechanosensitive ion channel domain-containing protein [Puia sp.]